MSLITNLTRIGSWLAVASILGVTLIFSSAYLYLSPKLPSVDVLRDVKLQTPLRVYTSDHQLIGVFGEKRREPIHYGQIPQDFVHAILSAEDDRFFSHHGVDLKGLLRAASQLLTSGQIQTGGSTITMQVAKNYFLSRERTFIRKFNEILLALQIERELPKEEILELYLNKIFLGNRAYGIQAAAQVYYGKPIDQLDLAQLAMIAGLPKAPSSFNPINKPARAVVRRNWILGRMLNLGYISPEQHREAINAPVTASYHGAKLKLSAPYVAELARKEAVNRFGQAAYTDGYKIFTTIGSKQQAAAQKAVIDGLLNYDLRHGYRGPENNLQAELAEDNPALWRDTLAKTPVAGGLVPAIVTAVHEQAFTALLPNNEEITVEWQNGLGDVRAYVNVNRLGPKPKTAGDIVHLGDLIRLKQNQQGSWVLSQLPKAQAALVSLRADDGAIISLVGGFDYQQSKFNRVTQATRQPGSNFKPFIYSAALEHGYTAASIINDAPIVFDDASLESTWRPTNSSGKFFGPTRLRRALFKSRNLVSIRLLRSLGINKAINYVERFGFDAKQLPKDLSLALGSHSLTPLSIVSAYSSLANGGYKINAYLIDRIETVDGETIFKAQPMTVCRDCDQQPEDSEIASEDIEEANSIDDILNEETEEIGSIDELLNPGIAEEDIKLPAAERIMDERVNYIMDSFLKDVVTKGTGRRALVLRRSDLAGKTGTTNGPTDAWFSGYGGGIVTTAWLGFDKNELIGRKEFGGSAALPIWIDYMRVALKGVPETVRKQPEGIVTVKIDPDSGKLAAPGQSNAIFEIFRAELAPTEVAEAEDINDESPEDAAIQEGDIF